jgi:hypothetical protein
MSVSGLCRVCQSSEADDSCDRCGQLVCEEHLDDRTHRCVECVAELGRPEGRDPTSDEMPDGVDTYEF